MQRPLNVKRTYRSSFAIREDTNGQADIGSSMKRPKSKDSLLQTEDYAGSSRTSIGMAAMYSSIIGVCAPMTTIRGPITAFTPNVQKCFLYPAWKGMKSARRDSVEESRLCSRSVMAAALDITIVNHIW